MKAFNKKEKQKGFTLLFAVILTVIILSVGASIISISLKQIILSGSARESQFAFYAANTGIECAYYWDLKGDDDGNPVFLASSTELLSFNTVYVKCVNNQLSTTGNLNTTCNGGIYGDNSGGWCVDKTVSTVPATKFRITFDNPLNSVPDLPYCADVIVKKHLRADGTVGTTTIESRGYNTCDSNSPRRVERELELIY